jgi:hypothetical protein
MRAQKATWISDWNPEDLTFWNTKGRAIALRLSDLASPAAKLMLPESLRSGGTPTRSVFRGQNRAFRNIPPIPFDAKLPPVCPLDLRLRDRPTGAQQHQQQVRRQRGRDRQ